ncbi:RHS repeat-associated core domain-containing protein [Micromonospora lupini]|uniref:RHS repeat-associated core domain-containing protein n=1 Tax=Micromonospora lupini TaxID=285679 RepID=UPI0033D06558
MRLNRKVDRATRSGRRRGSGRGLAGLVLRGGLVGALVAGLLAGAPASAAPAPTHLSAQVEKLDRDGGPVRTKAWPYTRQRQTSAPTPIWPAAESASVGLPVGAKRTSKVRAGRLPVSVARAAGSGGDRLSTVQVALLDRTSAPKAWQDGLLLRVSGEQESSAVGAAQLSVDYDDFRYAHGGDWASRLRLWRLPDCALSTPEADGCAATPLPSANNTRDGVVTADVPVRSTRSTGSASTLVALAAGPSGSSGDFTATSLAPSATWSAGGSAGDFNWSYEIGTPPAIGGPAPEVEISYSSGSVDGRSEATNNQPSWLGEGFEYAPGYIERRYVNCIDDMANGANNTTKTGDLCWRSDNATLSLNGSGSELVYEAGKGWHARDEDASRIEKLTGAGNGDNNGEYWKVTGADGTQYFFGLHSLPGQSVTTNSAWAVPVAGNHSGEPCNQSSFGSSFCDQVWRWNLDYVVDVRGNTMSYWYSKETNKYAQNLSSSTATSYVRGGQLARIDYGTWDRGSTDRSVKPVTQVVFTTADRCVTSSCATHNATNWPDTPWDQECTGTSCSGKYSPTFWSTRRLSKVTTRVWDTTRSTPDWQDVDSWTFGHSFPPTGDGSDHAGLWLDKIEHSGLVGTAITLPPVTFTPVSMPNRVLTANNTSNNWQRLDQIVTETGAKIDIDWDLPECSSSNLPSAPDTNTMRCYPVRVPDPDDPTGKALMTEWWHKHRIKSVSESDLPTWQTGHPAPNKYTYYEYVGAPAWHYADDDGLTKTDRKTWDQFRGYATVRTRVGDPGDQTLTETRYLRGMHGDRLAPSGGTRSVTVPATLGSETVYDEDQFAGTVREEVVYNGSTAKPVSKNVSVPWMSPATASRTINGDTVTARFTGTRVSYAAQAVGVDGARGWRTSRTENWFSDSYGTVESTQEDGDTAKSGDEKCATITYNRSTSANLVKAIKRTTMTALPCGTPPTSIDHVVGDTRYYYDGATSVDTAPVDGAVTRTESLKDWSPAGGTTWQTTKRSTFDAFGRVLTSTDVRGNTTTTVYTPASGGPVTQEQMTAAAPYNWVTTKQREPYRGNITRTTDPNGGVVDTAYDALGRNWRVWNVGWPYADHQSSPSVEYTYTLASNRDAYPYTTTRTLHAGGAYRVTYNILDSLLRERQTQTAGVGGGIVVTDTIYDKLGRGATSYGAHAEPGTPSGTLWWEPEWSVPAVTKTVFDGASRPTTQIFLGTDGVTNLVEKWRTTTSYEGDLTKVTPPAGGTPTTTVTDIKGRTVELRQHTTANGVNGAYQSTWYTYDPKDKLTAVTDHLGDKWSYVFDVKGRVTRITDPDKGTSQSQYNEYDELEKTTDARGEVIWYSYDSLGRKTGLRDDSATGPLRAEWKYDKLYTGSTTGAKGQLTEAYRYDYPNAVTNTYKWRVSGFNTRYQPTGVNYVIPDGEGTGLAGTWSYGYGYSPYDGSPTSVTYPAGGGLTTEKVTTEYDSVTGLPKSLGTNAINVASYVIGQQYTSYGEPTITTRKTAGGVYVEDATYYDLTTRRVSRTSVKPETATGTVSDRNYSYDATGNITSIADGPQVGTADTQCFRYDALRRLTSGWTPKAGVTCDTGPSVTNLGGPAPYWLDWTLDEIGNRRQEVSHTSGGDTTRTFGVPTAGANAVRPHAVDQVTTTTATQKYGYDASGNMTCRPAAVGANDCTTGTGSQRLTWDAEGRLATVTAGVSLLESIIYDTDGARLLRRDATGTTLYLPGQDIRRDSNSVISGTRYYTFAGKTVASRNPNGLTWLYTDHQGTQHTAVNSASQATVQRRQLPYGGARGSVPAWPTTRGFVGGDTDPVGLTHLGAREYDPTLGRFISVDPIQDLGDPQQWNSYAYANNNPTTLSDPSGQKWEEETGAAYNERLLRHYTKQREKAKAPTVKNPKLRNLLGSVYNRDRSQSWEGDGKLGTAVRIEVSEGRIVGPKGWHYDKAAEVFNGLADLLEKDRKARADGKPPMLTDRERQIALDEARELYKALQTEDTSGRFMAEVTSTAQGRAMLADAKKDIAKGVNKYSVKEITGTKFNIRKRGERIIGIDPVGAPRMVGVANMLSVLGDLVLIYEVGKAFASDNPGAALNDILCGFGSPACSPYLGSTDSGYQYFRGGDGEVFVVPPA